jgi:hypothetical protein
MRGRLRDLSALRHFIDGMVVAALMCLIFFMSVDLVADDAAWIGVFGNIFVALITLAAAWIALGGNRVQVAQNYDIQDTIRLNSLIAARAVLPVVLAEMTRIAENNLRVNFVSGHGPINDDWPEVTSILPLSSDLIPPFKECIIYADAQSQVRMANLLRHLQVAQSRHAHLPKEKLSPSTELQPWTVDNHNTVYRAIDWAVIYALIVDMFEFARGSQAAIPLKISPEKVYSAFLTAGITIELYPNLELLLDEAMQYDVFEKNWETG